MSNLIKHEKNEIHLDDNHKTVIPSGVPVSKRSRELYLAAKNHPRVNSLHDKNLVVGKVHEYINQTIMDLGVNMSAEEIQYLKMRVTDDVIKKYSQFTLEEIRLAFYYGVRGELGKYYGLNAVTFDGWLKSYRSQLLAEANKEMEKYLPKPEPKKESLKVIDRKFADHLCEIYDKLVTEGKYEFYDYGSAAYFFLGRLGLLKQTTERKQQLLEESRNKLKLTFDKRNSILSEKRGTVKELDLKRAYKQLEEKSNPTFEEHVKVGAMRLAVAYYFHDLAREKADFKLLIDEKLASKKYDDEEE